MSVIPAERRLGAIPIKMLDQEPMPDTGNLPLERGVPAFCRGGVCLGGSVRTGANEFPGRVIGAQMCPELASDPAAGGWFVGEQNAFQRNVAQQEGGDCTLAMRSGSLGAGLPATFNGGDNHRLAAAALWAGLRHRRAGISDPLALAADVCFAGFDKATQEPQSAPVRASGRRPGERGQRCSAPGCSDARST
jgi:hypothetical protein